MEFSEEELICFKAIEEMDEERQQGNLVNYIFPEGLTERFLLWKKEQPITKSTARKPHRDFGSVAVGHLHTPPS